MADEPKTINIHGKQYTPVSERVKMAHANGTKKLSIQTEILNTDPVVVKATVETDKGTFTGISAANPAKMIEKSNPYEVAETSAVGRALGFAGYGIDDGIASADEISKSDNGTAFDTNKPSSIDSLGDKVLCKNCGRFYHPPTFKNCWKCNNDPEWMSKE